MNKKEKREKARNLEEEKSKGKRSVIIYLIGPKGKSPSHINFALFFGWLMVETNWNDNVI